MKNMVIEQGVMVGVWWVYMARCRDGSLYTGISTDVARRIETHNRGRGAKSLRGRLPVHPVWTSGPFDRGEALREEARIKALSKQEKEAFLLSGHSPDGC